MNDKVFSDVATISEFMLLTERFKHIEGWLSPVEGYLLYRLARDGEGSGAIVEIGSWMGLSTAWLAAGSKAAGREHVHAVDVFDGGPVLKDHDFIRKEGTTYHRFTENLEGLGLFDYVEPIVAESGAAAQAWTKGAVRLLFIDGDHRYPAVKQDFDLWTLHVVAGGIVVLDDASEHYPGVMQLLNEVLADGKHWQHLLRAGKTQIFRKLQ
ncbi:MAG: class I SAM-dependent methyltransferase [Betaproteobacteria bacterium]|nr:class I SAM-dependent methyltransferase [Betaproteobacteria bacterium]